MPDRLWVVNVPERVDGVYLFVREEDARAFLAAANGDRDPAWGDCAEISDTPVNDTEGARHLINAEIESWK